MAIAASGFVHAGEQAHAGTRRSALLAIVLGLVFLAGTGFSHISAAHNAAHDARHAAGFPCH
jgi:cobalt transporter subunit CbtB